jgi:hypothetical protein
MNSQLPPVDPDVRDQLARRAGGRMPEGLLEEVMTALDDVSVEKPRRVALSSSLWRAPRTAVVGAGLSLAAVLVFALVAVPLLRAPTAGPSAAANWYPADRALYADELAYVLSDPTLAPNTTLVASVIIELRSDVCPMNRYPTVGVIAGLESQVCVMAASLGQVPTGDRDVAGTFAFRYLAPGYLGLLAEIKPASSSRLAFGVTDSWPTDGSYIVVEGYLGTTPIACDPAESQQIGDVLDPVEYEACSWSWLSEDGSPAPVLNVPTPEMPAPDSTSTAAPRPSIDTLALTGKARHVWVGGARQIDSIPTSTIHGVFVVEIGTGGCPGALPIDSYGCPYWAVIARVPALTLDEEPTATAAPTAAAGYPTQRALTADELARVIAGPALAVNTALVASVTVNAAIDGCPISAYPAAADGRPVIGTIEGITVCLIGAKQSARLPEGSISGTFAFRYLAPGYLGLVGEITPASPSRLAFGVADAWPASGEAFLVQGWLGASEPPDGMAISCALTPTVGDPLDPDGADCPYDNWLSDDGTPPSGGSSAGSAEPSGESLSLRGHARYVQAGGVRLVDSIDYTAPAYGTYVVRIQTGGCKGSAVKISNPCWHVLARVPEITGPEPATQSPSEPPATPVTPEPSWSFSPGVALPGLVGPGGRPLTQDEFKNAWTTDPDHLGGLIVITKGPIGGDFFCWYEGLPSPSPTCRVGVNAMQLAPEGYWAVGVGTDGRFTIIGEVTFLNDLVAVPVDDLLPVKERGAPDLVDQYTGDLMVVSGLLRCTTQNEDWINGVDYGLQLEGDSCDKVKGADTDLPEALYLVRIGRPATLLAPMTPIGK